MKKIENKPNAEAYIKRLGIAALCSVLFCGLLGFLVLYCYFAPRDNGSVIFEVPGFIGCAEDEIEETSVVDIHREWIYSDDVARGTVVSQTPHANSRRKIAPGERCAVTLFISLGEKTCSVPELCGVDALSAAAALRSLGAKIRTVAIYDEGEDGTVIGTSPCADSEIRSGDTVTVYVSRRKVKQSVNVPDFCGMELGDAARLALSLGLFLDECDGTGIVISQSIPSGMRVMADSYISFETDGGGFGREKSEREWPPVIE